MKAKPKLPLLPTTLLCAALLCGATARAADKGTPVTVTPEMKGAGIVSSGLALPKPPRGNGQPKPNPGKPKPPHADEGQPKPGRQQPKTKA